MMYFLFSSNINIKSFTMLSFHIVFQCFESFLMILYISYQRVRFLFARSIFSNVCVSANISLDQISFTYQYLFLIYLLVILYRLPFHDIICGLLNQFENFMLSMFFFSFIFLQGKIFCPCHWHFHLGLMSSKHFLFHSKKQKQKLNLFIKVLQVDTKQQ